MERLWYTGHPVPGGDLMFDVGLGYHPNRNVMDAFAGVAVPGPPVELPRLAAAAPRSADDHASGRCRSACSKGCAGIALALGPTTNPASRFELEFHAR